MKKIRLVSLLVAAATMLSAMTACGLSMDTNKILKTFEEAAAKNDALAYINIQSEENFSMSTTATEETHTLSSITKTDLKATKADGKMTGFRAKASTTLYGFTMSSEIYYKDGVLYSNSMDGQIKLSNPTEQDLKPYEMTYHFFRYQKDMLRNASMSETENGIEIAVVFAGNEFKQAMVDFLPENYFETISGSENYLDQVNFSDIKTNYTIKDGYITDFKITFLLEITIDGKPTSINYAYTLKFMAPGKDGTLTYPEDLDQYKELS